MNSNTTVAVGKTLIDEGLAPLLPYSYRLQYSKRISAARDFVAFLSVSFLLFRPGVFIFFVSWLLIAYGAAFWDAYVSENTTQEYKSGWQRYYKLLDIEFSRVFLLWLLFLAFGLSLLWPPFPFAALPIGIISACIWVSTDLLYRINSHLPSELSQFFQPIQTRSLVERLDTNTAKVIIAVSLLLQWILLYDAAIVGLILNAIFYVGIVFYFLPHISKPENWQAIDNALNNLARFLRQSLRTLTRWYILLAPGIIFGSFVTYLTDDLWLLVSRLSLSHVVVLFSLPLLGALVIGYRRAKTLTKDKVEINDYSDIDDLVRPAFTAIIENGHFHSSYFPLLEDLRTVKQNNAWQLNHHVWHEQKVKLIEEYQKRFAVSLIIAIALVLPVTFVLYALVYLIALPKEVLLTWLHLSESSAADWVWILNDGASLSVQLEAFLIGLQGAQFVNILDEPIMKMATLGTSFTIALLVLETATRVDTLNNLMRLSENETLEHFSLLMFHHWLTHPDYQCIQPGWSLMRPFQTSKQVIYKTDYNFLIALVKPTASTRQMRIWGKEIVQENNSQLTCVIFMSPMTYLQMRPPFFRPLPTWVYFQRTFLPLKDRYHLLAQSDPEHKSNFWVWNPHNDGLKRFEQVDEMMKYIESEEYETAAM